MIKISTKTRYGLRALLELAGNRNSKPVNLQKISEKQNISFKYLENIFSLLKNNNVVRSIRGSKGGYVFAKSPDEINLYEIFIAINGPLSITDCVIDPSICERSEKCPANKIWDEFQQKIIDFFKSKTLIDIMKQKVKGDADEAKNNKN